MSGEGTLEALYRERLRPVLSRFEETANVWTRRTKPALLVGLPAAFVWMAVWDHLRPDSLVAGLPAVVVLGWLGIAHYLASRGLREGFKRDVVSEVVRFVHDGLRYDPAGTVSREEFEASRLFLAKARRFRGEDLVSGKVGKTELRFCEIRSTRGKKEGKDRDVLFDGLFLVADFPKTIGGSVWVLPDGAEEHFGYLARTVQRLDRRRGELAEMEDPEFERRFRVYATDPVEARYVLSPTFMERLVDFASRRRESPLLALHGRSLYVAIPCREDRLEPPEWWQLYGLKPGSRSEERLLDRLHGYLREIREVLAIVDELALNTRLWRYEGSGEGAPRIS